jgi:hypothetical protein
LTADDYVLGLAQGLTGMLAITYALVAVLADRTVKRYRVRDVAYTVNLALLLAASLSSVVLSSLAWWSWAHIAPEIALLFGASAGTWLAVVFGGSLAASIGVAGIAGWKLIQMHRASAQTGSWDP